MTLNAFGSASVVAVDSGGCSEGGGALAGSSSALMFTWTEGVGVSSASEWCTEGFASPGSIGVGVVEAMIAAMVYSVFTIWPAARYGSMMLVDLIVRRAQAVRGDDISQRYNSNVGSATTQKEVRAARGRKGRTTTDCTAKLAIEGIGAEVGPPRDTCSV